MDGSVAADSIMPSCGTDNKIRLLSYNYRRIKCHFSTGCDTEHEEPLSPAAKFLLHKMCSWKNRCSNLTFPLRSVEQVNVTNAINIKYRCFAHRNRHINICEKGEKNFTNTVYLISDKTAKFFQECYCFVSKGTFSIGIVDLRLSQKEGMLCSSAALLINSKEFKCNSEKNDFGAIFNKNNFESTSNAFISLKLNSLSAIPDKMVISLTPEAVAKINCFRKKLASGDIPEASTLTSEIQNLWTFTSNVESVTRESVVSTVTCSRNQAADNVPRENWLVAIGQGVTMVLMVFIGLLLFYRRYLYLKEKWTNKWLRRERESPSHQTSKHDTSSIIKQCSDHYINVTGSSSTMNLTLFKRGNDTIIQEETVKMLNPEELHAEAENEQGDLQKMTVTVDHLCRKSNENQPATCTADVSNRVNSNRETVSPAELCPPTPSKDIICA